MANDFTIQEDVKTLNLELPWKLVDLEKISKGHATTMAKHTSKIEKLETTVEVMKKGNISKDLTANRKNQIQR